MSIQTAFQIGAFQFNAFQEGQTVGGGGWWSRDLWAQMVAAARRRKKRKERETVVEQDDEIAQPETVELFFRPVTPIYSPMMVKLIGDKRIDEARELAEYTEVMKMIVALEDA